MATVSVVIPVYNGGPHIRAAIGSVLAQEGVALELVVVDNASTDDTVAIVEAAGDPRLRLERNPTNIGAPANFDRALGLATGDYVKLLPADDLVEPGALAAQAAVLDRDATLAFVFGARRIIDADGRAFARRGLPARWAGAVPAAALVRRTVRAGTNVIGEPGAVLFRRSAAQAIGGFDPALPYVIDLDYWIRLLAQGGAHYLPAPAASFRIAAGSWSSTLGDRQAGEMVALIDRLRGGGFGVTALDAARGKAMARLNNRLRLAFYRYVVRG